MADGVWKGVYPYVLGVPSTFSFYEKSRRREKRRKKRMLFLVATNVIASRLPERRTTGTPHARAKKGKKRLDFGTYKGKGVFYGEEAP